MSTDATLSLSPADSTASPIIPPQPTRSLREVLLFGSATLGIAVGLERVLGFVSSVLAARISGPQTFGAYSVVLATAGTIAAYAGAGIGTTATRFSGQYPRASPGYRKFLSTIIAIALASAIGGALLMLAGAGPLARWVLRNEALTSILRIAAISSAAIILFECCRGLLIGQQRFRSQLVLSFIFGAGLLMVLPLAANSSAALMIAAQASVALLCVAICVAFAKPLGISPISSQKTNDGPGAGPLLGFGLVQFGAFAGVSIATWWVALLVARSDATLTQMGLYAIANQFRGLAALAPMLCSQVGYPLLTNESGSKFGGAGRVMLTNSLLTTALATMAAGLAIVCAPWILLLIYGKSFTGAEGPVLILLATGILHMSGGPAMQRLSIVHLRALGIINTVWAVTIVALALWLVPRWGAAGAALAFLISHALSNLLVMRSLSRLRELPGGYLPLMASCTAASFALAIVAYGRSITPADSFILTAVLGAIWMMALLSIWRISTKTGCFSEWARKPFTFGPVPDQSDVARS